MEAGEKLSNEDIEAIINNNGDIVPEEWSLAMAEEIKEHRAGEVARSGEWISAKKSLPKYGHAVLVYHSAYNSYQVNHLTSKGWFINEHGMSKLITHWMPLPEPPTE